MTPGIAADAPVQRGTGTQSMEPLAAARAVVRRQSPALSISLEVARLPISLLLLTSLPTSSSLTSWLLSSMACCFSMRCSTGRISHGCDVSLICARIAHLPEHAPLCCTSCNPVAISRSLGRPSQLGICTLNPLQ